MGERRVFVGEKRVDSFRHDSRDAESDAYQLWCQSPIGRYFGTVAVQWPNRRRIFQKVCLPKNVSLLSLDA